jgi:hypothetical protein
MAVGAPLRWATEPVEVTCKGYHETVPEWVLYGKLEPECLDTIMMLFRKGMVPEECVEWYSRRLFHIGRSTAPGLDRAAWVPLAHRIRMAKGRWSKFNRDEDMFDQYPYGSTMEKNRAGIGLRALLTYVDLECDEYALKILEHHRGEKHGLVVALLLYYVGVVQDMRPALRKAIEQSGILLVRQSDFIEVCKEVHTMTRYTGMFFGVNLSLEERSKCMYIHTLYGREHYEVDETKEINDRQESPAVKVAFDGISWTPDKYHELFTEGVDDAYRRLREIPPPAWDGFLDFWERRKNWAAKGSTVLNTTINKKYDVTVLVDGVCKVVSKRHNKKSLFEDPATLENVLNEVVDQYGLNTTKVVPKFESAAQRALLPGNLYHYIVFSVVLSVFEKGPAVGSAGINSIPDDDFREFDVRVGDAVDRFCYDFTNFNVQHSTEDMKIVIDRLRACTPERGLLDWSIRWIRDSMDKMEVITESGNVPLKRGLYSGWRGTTWINSVCNHAYFYVARKCFEKLHGYDGVVYYEGKGDDVEAHMLSHTRACQLYEICETIGYDANRIKQLFGDVSEFLRILYEKDGMWGSVARALGNYVSGNWEGEGGSVADRLKSRLENVMKMRTRGLSKYAGDLVYKCALLHWGRLKMDDEWVRPSPCVLHARVEDNGLGVPDEQGRLWILESKLNRPEKGDLFMTLPHVSATADWVQAMDGELRRHGIVMRPDKAGISRLAEDSYDLKTIAESWTAELDKEAWAKYWISTVPVASYDVGKGDDKGGGLIKIFLGWLDEKHPELEAYDKVQAYDSLSSFMPVGWREKLGGEYNYHGAGLLKATLPPDVMIPQYVVSNGLRWVKSLVLCRQVDVEWAQQIFWDLCTTYSKLM